MKLETILKEITHYQIRGSSDVLITGITGHSKHVAPGNVFIAKKGKAYDGSKYIPEAIQNGAIAIVTDAFDPSLEGIVQIIHPQIALIESTLADNYYRHPSQELLMVGITGTNGKTTTSFIIKNLLDSLIGPCGLIGTIEYIVGPHRYKATHTTPDVITNQKMLRDMVVHGCRAAVMEVSSHALDQGRVDKIDFDVAIFSNLTVDHLDYHVSMENYGNTKKKLFEGLGREKSKKEKMKWAIVNQDSPWTPKMIEGCSANVLSYGIDNEADVKASHICLEGRGTRAKVHYQGKSAECYWPLVGRFNVYNCLAAMAVALSQNISLEKVVGSLSEIGFVRGRLQPVPNSLGIQIYVDFAHSADALLNVLSTLKEMRSQSGRIIVVFGCGGDRDRSKRPEMAEACATYADQCIVTSDNPRSEDPHKICAEIASGFSNSNFYQIELDRRKAIQKAIACACPGDIVLIAGKGHETVQIFADKMIEFDDCKVAAEICTQLISIEK